MSRKDDKGFTRRDFMKCSALLGGAFLASEMKWAEDLVRRAEAGTLTPEEEYELIKAENILYTSCLQCNTGCGIKVKLFRRNGNAVVLKIDGNPYNPFVAVPNFPYKSSPYELNTVDMAICPKGQSGIQATYDPYRVLQVLKRAGKRGENKWQTVSFDQAIDEIVNGGVLFPNVPGEEKRVVAGLKDIYVLKDRKIASAMAADGAAILSAKDKKKAVEDFKVKHAQNLHYLIDPDHPDLGPKNNQMVYWWGRLKAGRAEFGARFFGDYFGTVNTHGHTTVCQGSLYFTCKAMSEQYEGNKFTGGPKFYWQADAENSRYVLSVGSNLFDANYGPPNRNARIIPNLTEGKTKLVVVDPRFNKSAAKANRYMPIKPGTDGAFFMALMRAMLKDKKYDQKYLSNANKGAAKAAGEPTWSNAVLLVKIDKEGNPGKFLRGHEINISEIEKRKDKTGKEYTFEYMVAVKDGKPVPVDPNDEKNPITGELFVNTEINGIKVKSALQILSESANARTMAEWSQVCGIPVKDIELTAQELTSYGKNAAVDIHRGVAQHTNGFYNVTAAMTVNLLLGNFDWKGGMIAASTYSITGGKEGQPFDFGKLTPNKMTKFGTSIIRHDLKYEDSTLFKGYPAKRNWYPLASDVYEEIMPSMGDQYPYPVKAVFGYMGTPAYSLPAGQTNIEILTDLEKVPLYFTTDVIVGTTTMYADYIFPNDSYLERWEFHGSHPNMPSKVQPVRQPVIAPLQPTVKVFGQEMPCGFESVLLALAERLKMPGFGKDAFGPGQDLLRPDDMFIRMVANLATDGSPVPDADDREMKLFLDSRAHLPKSVFDPKRWEAIAGPNWRKVVYVLNRGGRFQDYKDIYKGDQVVNKYGRLINIYQEKTAGTKNSFTGRVNAGYAAYVPVLTTLGKSPKEAGLEDGYPLHLITEKSIAMTKSRTITNYWLLTLLPENSIVINPIDAQNLGVKDGDRVKVVSATNKEGIWDLKNGNTKLMIGKVQVTETIMPGVVTFMIGYGHWATGAADVTIDGSIVKGDPRRGTGVHANAAMWVDPYLKNTCMLDPIGGSVSFYDTKVKLVKV